MLYFVLKLTKQLWDTVKLLSCWFSGHILCVCNMPIKWDVPVCISVAISNSPRHMCYVLLFPLCLKFSHTVSFSNENHGNVALITGDWWHCTVFQLAFTLQGRSLGGSTHPIVAWRWRFLHSAEMTFLHFWRIPPLPPLQPCRPLLAELQSRRRGYFFPHLPWYSELEPCCWQPVNYGVLNQVDGGLVKLADGSEGQT